jgi:hypothetical protein
VVVADEEDCAAVFIRDVVLEQAARDVEGDLVAIVVDGPEPESA